MLETFLAALSVVCTMLIYAVPGFILIKTKLVKSDQISAFAKLLMYVSSPCLVFHSITKNEFSLELVGQMAIAFLFALGFFLLGIGLFYLVFKKKSDDVRYRVYNLACVLSNCAFMGVPVLEALLPGYAPALAFSAMFSLAMNIVSWSLGAFIISHDKKYISPKKIFLNPAVIGLIFAAPVFAFSISVPDVINAPVTLLAKMSAPLCMLIMGMRLACASLKEVFFKPSQYVIVALKQLVFPLLVFVILLPLPIEQNLKASIYIILSCPVASVILSFSEMINKGQKSAANLVLLGTSLSAITVPIMSLLI